MGDVEKSRSLFKILENSLQLEIEYLYKNHICIRKRAKINFVALFLFFTNFSIFFIHADSYKANTKIKTKQKWNKKSYKFEVFYIIIKP